jgi:formiminotetrahydrofolate cyclodeaminase
MATLSELADTDSLVFQGYLEACELPRATEGEKASRKAARETALMRATQIPLEAAVQMVQGLEFAETAATLIDDHVRSEVLAGEMLLRASIKSVLLNVDANLPGIADSAVREAIKLRRDDLERTVTASEDPTP